MGAFESEGEGLRLSSPMIPHRFTLPVDEEDIEAAFVATVVDCAFRSTGFTVVILLQILLLRAVAPSSWDSLAEKNEDNGQFDETADDED